ncbi:DENN domain-containing protein 2B-like isoform X1 [Alosa sapidissima]|uniref:DENN domain-containing protein 2B-like isoform X1 n=1 Tax=Alosa sapidissima TaxID=34773 RepID=UPI001C09269D|nr:DENN domain-containing protein 2B-like isoform X1 [Alosa sapidissima]XP_041965361.1 DENN domain-containing protein 2B-like isoform X1 [Alosa sapidissima]
MTANKNYKTASQRRGRGPGDIPERCQSVSPPPTLPVMRRSPHPFSDSEESIPRPRPTRPADHALLRPHNRNSSSLSAECPSLKLLRSRGIGRLDPQLSVFKPATPGRGRGQKENRLEGVSSGHPQSNAPSQGSTHKAADTSPNSNPPQKLSISRSSTPTQPSSPNQPGPEASAQPVPRRLPRREYCRVELPRMSLYVERRSLGEQTGGSEGCPSLLSSPCSDKAFDFQDLRKLSRAFSECSYPGTEDEEGGGGGGGSEVRRGGAMGRLEKRPSRREAQAMLLRSLSTHRGRSSVLSRVQEIEQALKDCPEQAPQYPSSCFGPGGSIPNPSMSSRPLGGLERKQLSRCTSPVPEFRPGHMRVQSPTPLKSPGAAQQNPPKGMPVNPLPKPKRTFEYELNHPHERPTSPGNGCPPQSHPRMLSPSPTPHLPRHTRQHIRTGSGFCRTVLSRDWYCLGDAAHRPTFQPITVQTNGTVSMQMCHRSGSKSSCEENPYEDISDAYDIVRSGNPPPVSHKESPDDEGDLRDRQSCLAREERKSVIPPQPSLGLSGSAGRRGYRSSQLSEKRVSSERLLSCASPSPCPSPIRPLSPAPDAGMRGSGETLAPQPHMRVPKLVQRIGSIYRSKRGKRRLKKLSVSNTDISSVREDNSGSESDSDDRFNVHIQRLLRLQSLLRRSPSYRTLELQLLQWQERRELFEHFLVVSLKKRPGKSSYAPEVSYQFPKLDRPTKQMREAEQRLKAIPQFCFPDAKDWCPVSQYNSESFSFMLTGEDGGRRFGYCRRLLPSGSAPRLPEVYCVISRLGCFDLFSKILDEVERRREISAALVYPFMRSLMESPFPAPGKTIRVKTFLPGTGNEVMELQRPADCRLEHVDLQSLFSCLSVPQIVRIFASLLLERRVVFVADKLSTLSSCAHAVVALLYPFSWQHTFIPVLPAPMLDMVCCPTPFLVGLLSSSLPRLKEMPLEETLMVDLRSDRFIRQIDDEATLLPRKLQAALEQALEQRDDLIGQDSDSESEDDSHSLNSVVSEAFIRFFLETVGHFPLFMTHAAGGERLFQRDAFRKAVASRSVRRFLGVFMESQMFHGFIQDQELRTSRAKGLFEVRVEQYLDELPETEQGGVNRFFRGLGSKIKFLQKKN